MGINEAVIRDTLPETMAFQLEVRAEADPA